MAKPRKVVPAMVRLSQETGFPLVATNDPHYLKSDAPRMRWHTPEFFLKSRAEMH